jgi:quinol monooxygenase YgiN
MYGLFGKITTHPGQRGALLGYLLEAANAMRDLDGCYLYVVSSAPDDPNGIWVYEAWKSQTDHQASLSLEATQALIAKARPLIADMSNRVEHTPLGGKGLTASENR